MDRVFAQSTRAFQYSDGLGVCCDLKGGHVGLFHIEPPRQVRQLHLAWHQRLRSESTGGLFVLWIQPPFPLHRRRQAAAFCRLVWRRNGSKTIPYAFSSPRGAFNSQGPFELGPDQVGLTCASFVLGVLDAVGLALVDYDTWQLRPDDGTWQEGMVEMLRGDAGEDHAARARQQMPALRFRPLEVAGAAASERVPVAMADAVVLGAKVDALLKALSPSPPGQQGA